MKSSLLFYCGKNTKRIRELFFLPIVSRGIAKHLHDNNKPKPTYNTLAVVLIVLKIGYFLAHNSKQ